MLFRSIPITINRGNTSLDITIPTKDWQLDHLKFNLIKSLGIETDKKIIKVNQQPGIHAIVYGLSVLKEYTLFNYYLIKNLIIGKISMLSLLGPASFLENALFISQQPIIIILYCVGIFSMAIMLLNLLPIPGLDGGHLLFLIIEKLKNSPVSIAIQVLAYRLSMILFYLLLVRIILNDVLRYFN